jgi:hypothetical protein
MSQIEIRPHHQEDLPYSVEEALERIRKGLASEGETLKGSIVGNHVTIRIPEAEQHFWTPELSLDFEDDGEGSYLRGLCGPRPSVWLMFIFFYFLLGAAIVVIFIIGYSQKNLGLSSGILWLIPILIGMVIAIYLTARAGQKLGNDEMIRMRTFLAKALDHEVR